MTVTVAQLAELTLLGTRTSVAGRIGAVNPQVTKQDRPYAVVSLADATGAIDVLVPPAVYDTVSGVLTDGATVAITGRLDRWNNSLRLIAEQVTAG